MQQFPQKDVKMLWVTDYYDGPLEGACEVAGRFLWFKNKYSDALGYDLFALSPDEEKFVREMNAAFCKHVGTHFTYTDEFPDQSQPQTEWPKFYDDHRWQRGVIVGECVGWWKHGVDIWQENTGADSPETCPE